MRSSSQPDSPLSSAPSQPRPSSKPLRHYLPHALIAAVLIAAAWILLGGLGEAGLWTPGELAILDRSLAALGEPRSNLERSPWLPDQLRTWAYAWTGRRDFGLRLPGALAGLGLVALTIATAWRLGWSLAWVAMAGCFALASPLLLASARTALGNPTGELWVSAAVVALLGAGDRSTPSRVARIGLGVIGAASLAAAVASLGIMLGGCLPLTLIALAEVAREPEHGELQLPRAATIAAWIAAALAGFVGLWLARGQADGYIPLLGAAKDLSLLEEPTRRGFTDTLEAFGYQLFPFTGLVVVGLLGPGRARWPALWLGVALVFTSLWSLRYGPTPAPVIVPAALLATSACQTLMDPDEPIAARRLVLTCAVLGALILGKDASRVPERIAAPLFELPLVEFPSQGVIASFEPSVTLPRMAKRFAGLLLLVHILAPPSADQRRWRARRETPWWLRQWAVIAAIFDRLLTGANEDSGLTRVRRHAPIVLVMLILAHQSWAYGRVLLGELDRQMSLAEPLRRFDGWVADGTVPDPQLGVHRIRDAGLGHYLPGPRQVFLATRVDLDAWLAASEPRVALIQRQDLPPAATAARTRDRPFHVLDAAHHQVLLVANFLPTGVADQNPLAGIVVPEPLAPELAHPTSVVWDPYVELIAWEIVGPLHRGSHATMHMLFRVQRPLPAGTQLYARLQRGKTSRVTAEPRDLTGGALPPNYWREGDLIHHQHPIEVPWLEVLPGEHELIVGLRRSEKTNLKITKPEQDTGEYGVTLRGKSHEFAVIGTTELAW
jgi:hypothetical protein